MEFVNYALNLMESGYQIDAIYTDIRKTFDNVSHRFLIQKLKEMGVHSCLLDWIKSYLDNRYQCVKVLGWNSDKFRASSGLPQGSYLGLLFFILFFNDAIDVCQFADLGVFADDLKMYVRINSIDDALRLQDDINLFSAWCKRNGLSVSISGNAIR